MRERSWILKIIMSLVLVVFGIILLVSYENYRNINQILRTKHTAQQGLIEKSILGTVKDLDIASQIVEQQLDTLLMAHSIEILEAYQYNPDIFSWDLEQLKQKYSGCDIFIIDDNLKVVAATYQPKLGLDLKQSPNLARILREFLQGNEFVSDRLDISAFQKNTHKYSYISSPDHRYLFQLAINIEQQFPLIQGLDFPAVASDLESKYSLVDSIRVYKVDRQGNLVNLPDGEYYLPNDERLVTLARKAILSDQVTEMSQKADGGEYRHTYRFLPYNTFKSSGELDWWNSYLIEIVYNDQELSKSLFEQQSMFLSNNVLVILLFAGLTMAIRYFFLQTEHNRKKLATVINQTSEGYCMMSLGLEITEVNNAMCQMVGYSREDLLGCNIVELMGGHLAESEVQEMIRSSKVHYKIETVLKGKDGHPVYVVVNATVVKDKLSNPRYIFAFIYDITARKQAEERLKYLSLHDPLTGLYNRTYFEQQIERIKEDKLPTGIIICDVDGLKLVNDTLGHKAGDSLLLVAAQVITKAFPEDSVVARIGGDEFAILLPGISEEQAEAAIDRLKNAVEGYNQAGPEIHLSISAGVALGLGEDNVERVLKEADYNMYREKLYHSRTARSTIVYTLIHALAARDFVEEGHTRRLQEMAADLAELLGLSEQQITALKLLCQFHDIGKVGISDSILFKPGPLNEEEKAEMRRHCEIGYRIAQSAPDLAPIAHWILSHHEWWNGQGYPLGLKEKEIPLECRILAVCDAYDAMISNRPYRTAMSKQKALAELKNCAGTQFDPYLIQAFIEHIA